MNFKKLMTEEYKQKRKEHEELERKKQERISHICSFTGHRPNKLYGYNLYNEDYLKLARLMKDSIIDLIENKKVDTFISGGALGIDTIAFLIIHKLKKEYPNIKNILAIPFKNQDANWFKQEDKNRYKKMKELADEVIYVDTLEEYKIKNYKENIYYPAKMQKRNEYMIDNSQYVIAVWDGKRNGGTWNCVKYANKTCGRYVIRINPKYFETDFLPAYFL